MNKIETLDFLIENNLKHYNYFHDHEDIPNEVVIDNMNETWLIVYQTDENNAHINIGEYANHEEAYEDFLTRVKEINDFNDDVIKIYRLMVARYQGVDYVAQFMDKPIVRMYTYDTSLLHLGFTKEKDVYFLDTPVDQCEYLKLFTIDVYDTVNRYCGEGISITGDIIYAINENLKTSTYKELQELGMLGESINKQDCQLRYKIQLIKGDEEGEFVHYTPTCDICGKEATRISQWGLVMCEDCYINNCDENVEIAKMSYEQRLLKIIELFHSLGVILEKYAHIPSIDNLHFMRHRMLKALKACLNTNDINEMPGVIRYHWCTMFLVFHDALVNYFYHHALKEDIIIEMQQLLSRIDQYIALNPSKDIEMKLLLNQEIIYQKTVSEEAYFKKIIEELVAITKKHIDTTGIHSFSLTRCRKASKLDIVSYYVQEDKMISNFLDVSVKQCLWDGSGELTIMTFKTEQERAKYLWKNNPECSEYKELAVSSKMIESWQKEEAKVKKSQVSKMYIFYIILFVIAMLSVAYIRSTDQSKRSLDDTSVSDTLFQKDNEEQKKNEFIMTQQIRYSIVDSENGKKGLRHNASDTILLEADEIDHQRSYLQFYRIDDYWYLYNLGIETVITTPLAGMKIVDYFAMNSQEDILYVEYFAISTDGQMYQIYNSNGITISEKMFTKEELVNKKVVDGEVIQKP